MMTSLHLDCLLQFRLVVARIDDTAPAYRWYCREELGRLGERATHAGLAHAASRSRLHDQRYPPRAHPAPHFGVDGAVHP
jgi:hypothetical protein